jgi:hypothetical protein
MKPNGAQYPAGNGQILKSVFEKSNGPNIPDKNAYTLSMKKYWYA